MINVKRLDSNNQVIETVRIEDGRLVSKANRVPVAFSKLIETALIKEGSIVIEQVNLSTIEKRCSDLITEKWSGEGYISAIKLYRSEMRATLKESRVYCEALRNKLRGNHGQ